MLQPQSNSYQDRLDGAQYLKDKGLQPLSTSQMLGWAGFIVEQRHDALSAVAEVNLPPFSDHFIAIHTGSPTQMLQKRDGQVYNRANSYGDINIMPAGLENYWSSKAIGNTTFSDDIFIWLDPAFVRKIVQESDLKIERVELLNLFEARDPQIEHIAFALKAEIDSHQLGGRVLAESLATALVVHLIRGYTTFAQSSCDCKGGLAKQTLHQAIDFIQTHLDQNISLEQMAASVHLSSYHFARLFKQSTGFAPHQYLIRCRVKQAQQLMLKSELPLCHIAAAVGFADRSHLSRHFKSIMGQTPQAFLQQKRTSKSIHNLSKNLHPHHSKPV